LLGRPTHKIGIFVCKLQRKYTAHNTNKIYLENGRHKQNAQNKSNFPPLNSPATKQMFGIHEMCPDKKSRSATNESLC